MTWIAEPAADAITGVARYENLQAYVAANESVLAIAAERLDDAAGEISPGGDTGTIQLAVDLRAVRETLLELCDLHKPILAREVVEQIRAAFGFANIVESEDRRELTERVAHRKVDRLRELTPEEATALLATLETLEESF